MKAHPSIAFNTLSGTAGEVTARETKNGTVLSSRAQHSKVYTPAQKAERAILSRIGRRFKTLTAEQVTAWNNFARPYTGQSGEYRLTGCNVYVRHNCNRALMGLEPIHSSSCPETYRDRRLRHVRSSILSEFFTPSQKGHPW